MKNGIGRQGFIKGFLSLLVLAAVVVVGVSFGKPYFRYNNFRSHTKDILQSEITVLQVIKEKVMAEAISLHIPLKEGDLEVSAREKVIIVKARWFEIVDFWGYYQKRVDFDMAVEY